MFDIAWSEFLVVAVVALVVVGPRDLPALLRTVGKTVASLRRMASEFQGQFNEAMREAELDDLKNQVTGLKNSASKMVGASPFQIARDEIKNALIDKPRTTPSALAGEGPAADVAERTPSALAPPAPEIAPVEDVAPPREAEFAAAPERRAAEAGRVEPDAPVRKTVAAAGPADAPPPGAAA
jgi:sec-independent protein translocase protein TatB